MQLKRNEITVASISVVDEQVILLIFINNEHFVNTVTMGQNADADAECAGRLFEEIQRKY